MAHPARIKKQTEHINFGKALDGIPPEIRKSAHEVTRRRQGLEEALNHTDDLSETVLNYLLEYLVVRDTLQSLKKKSRSSSRLRFKWTNFLHEDKVTSDDVEFDVASILVAVGLWHMDHANQLNSNMKEDEDNENKMKESLNALKTAAGIFECMKSLGHVSHGNKDIDTSSIRALHLQSLAEGQCVTINRAMKKGHKASLVSQLCTDVAEKYSSATQQLDEEHHLEHKWATYLKFQSEVYFALSRCFQGINLLEAEERCGDSIAVLNEANKHIEQAVALAKEYDKIKPKTKIHLAETASFVRVKKLITEKKAKSDRENSMIFHQKIPEDCPSLSEPKCLVQATPFHIPEAQDLTLTPSEDEVKDTSTDEGAATDVGATKEESSD